MAKNSGYGYFITDLGADCIRKAAATDSMVVINKVGVGDGGDASQEWDYGLTSLVNQTYEKEFDSTDYYQLDPNDPKQLMISCVIPNEVEIELINEVGFYDEEGNLIVYGLITPTLKEKGAAASQVLLQLDNYIRFENQELERISIHILDDGLQILQRTVLELKEKLETMKVVEPITNEEIDEITGMPAEASVVIGQGFSADEMKRLLDDNPYNDPEDSVSVGALSSDEILKLLQED